MEDARARLRKADESGLGEPLQGLPCGAVENFGYGRGGGESRPLRSDERRFRVENNKEALGGLAPAGYQTPASAYGPDFVLETEGVTREDVA